LADRQGDSESSTSAPISFCGSLQLADVPGGDRYSIRWGKKEHVTPPNTRWMWACDQAPGPTVLTPSSCEEILVTLLEAVDRTGVGCVRRHKTEGRHLIRLVVPVQQNE
jgi:hypothetical protein